MGIVVPMGPGWKPSRDPWTCLKFSVQCGVLYVFLEKEVFSIPKSLKGVQDLEKIKYHWSEVEIPLYLKPI